MYQRCISALGVVMFSVGCVSTADAQTSVIVPEGFQATYRDFQYAPAVRAGAMLYLSGVVARVEDGEASMIPAIERTFDEIETILSHAGARWSDVVDVTSYMTDLDAQIGPLWQVKGQRVPEPYPAWTAIGVQRLYGGDAAIIEIKVTAYLGDRPAPSRQREPAAPVKPEPSEPARAIEPEITPEPELSPEKPEKEKPTRSNESDHDSPYDVDYDSR